MKRRLAAILAADVVGYSRLIRADEEGTIAALKALRADLIDPKIAEHNGRIVKLMGDGVLVEFASVVDAVRAAVETQQAVAQHNARQPEDKRIEFRVGINLGDVVIDGDDIHGDGVNVAARLEGLAEPGGICISDRVYEEVRDRFNILFEDLGEQELKNLDRPVRVWHWQGDTTRAAVARGRLDAPSLPGKPSIAVLSFENMSGDPEQEYFADGISEDIITALSKYRWFFISSRNSTFAYKGTAIDIKQIGRELNVGYILEGSVRKAGNRVRITAQLIEAESGHHIWAERYDRDLADIFDLQDEIQQAIVTAVEPELASAEYYRASKKTPGNLAAWDLLQQAMWHMNQRTLADAELAEPLFEKAIALDPSIARAYAGYARLLVNKVGFGWCSKPNQQLNKSKALAIEAIRKDDRDPFSHDALGRVFSFLSETENAIREHRIAMQLNPNSAYTRWGLAEALWMAGQYQEGLVHVEEAIRLSPRDPVLFLFETIRGCCLDGLGLLEEAENAFLSGFRLKPNVISAATYLADFYIRHDRVDEARTIIERAIEQVPNLDCTYVRNAPNPLFLVRGEDLISDLKKAGLPGD